MSSQSHAADSPCCAVALKRLPLYPAGQEEQRRSPWSKGTLFLYSLQSPYKILWVYLVLHQRKIWCRFKSLCWAFRHGGGDRIWQHKIGQSLSYHHPQPVLGLNCLAAYLETFPPQLPPTLEHLPAARWETCHERVLPIT